MRRAALVACFSLMVSGCNLVIDSELSCGPGGATCIDGWTCNLNTGQCEPPATAAGSSGASSGSSSTGATGSSGTTGSSTSGSGGSGTSSSSGGASSGSSGGLAGCNIAGQPYDPGESNPSNECQFCDPDAGPDAWAQRSDGYSCNGGVGFCVGGSCQFGCWIGDAGFVSAGELDPANSCSSCQPALSATGWTAFPDRTACGATAECLAGVCTDCQSGQFNPPIVYPDSTPACYVDGGAFAGCPTPATSPFHGQDGDTALPAPVWTQYQLGSDLVEVESQSGLMFAVSAPTEAWPDAGGYCANLRTGGYSDWRLPTMAEAVGVEDLGRLSPPVVPWAPAFAGNVWTSFQHLSTATLADWSTGNWSESTIGSSFIAQCVRGNVCPMPATRFVLDGGWVTDSATGLTWQQAATTGTWFTAVAACADAGARLPSLKELLSVVDTSGCTLPSPFPAPVGGQWTSTPDHTLTNQFDGPNVANCLQASGATTPANSANQYRCVR